MKSASGVGPFILSIQNVANTVAASAFVCRNGIFSTPPPPLNWARIFFGGGVVPGLVTGCCCNKVDTLAMLQQKTKGNVTPAEENMLQNVLYELRMAYLEVTNLLTHPPQGGVEGPGRS